MRRSLAAALAFAGAQGAAAATLEPADLPGLCLTLPEGATAAVSAMCTGAPEQEFGLPGPDGGVLRHGDACMGVDDAGNYPELTPRPCDSAPEIYWIVDHKGRLANNAGRCLAVLGLSAREGERVYGARCEDWFAQTWRFADAAVEKHNATFARLRIAGAGNLCLAWQEKGNYFAAAPCDESGGQRLALSRGRPTLIRKGGACLRAPITGSPVALGDCHADALWTIEAEGTLHQGAACVVLDDRNALVITPCAQPQRTRVAVDPLP